MSLSLFKNRFFNYPKNVAGFLVIGCHDQDLFEVEESPFDVVLVIKTEATH